MFCDLFHHIAAYLSDSFLKPSFLGWLVERLLYSLSLTTYSHFYIFDFDFDLSTSHHLLISCLEVGASRLILHHRLLSLLHHTDLFWVNSYSWLPIRGASRYSTRRKSVATYHQDGVLWAGTMETGRGTRSQVRLYRRSRLLEQWLFDEDKVRFPLC